MRIVGGRYKGYTFKPFKASHTRPTTDMAKEAVCNVLSARFNLVGASILDLFAGTGNMSLEFLSRGALQVVSVDQHIKNLQYMMAIKKELGIENWDVVKAEVTRFCSHSEHSYDLVFADPPYDWPGIHNMVQQVLHSDILKPQGMFIVEHTKTVRFDHESLIMKKEYGISCFSFFIKA